MSTLWTSAMAHTAMPWQVHPGEEHIAHGATHVKDAGFAGFVQHPAYERVMKAKHKPFDHNLWNDVEPEPTDEDFAHFDEHGEFSPDHLRRHREAYDAHQAREQARDVPDHTSGELASFQRGEAVFPETWEKHGEFKQVGLKGPVFATQSHVNQAHINRYNKKPDDKSWYEHKGGSAPGYKGNEHPLFVTHQGRLHVIEGHHRVAAALQRGDSHIQGWHINLDDYNAKFQNP